MKKIISNFHFKNTLFFIMLTLLFGQMKVILFPASKWFVLFHTLFSHFESTRVVFHYQNLVEYSSSLDVIQKSLNLEVWGHAVDLKTGSIGIKWDLRHNFLKFDYNAFSLPWVTDTFFSCSCNKGGKLEYTVWELKNFSLSLILCEINSFDLQPLKML